MASRRRNAEEANMTDADLRRKKSREAAKKCREKKENQMKSLTEKNKMLEEQNNKYMKEREELREKIASYIRHIEQHKEAGCSLPRALEIEWKELLNFETTAESPAADSSSGESAREGKETCCGLKRMVSPMSGVESSSSSACDQQPLQVFDSSCRITSTSSPSSGESQSSTASTPESASQIAGSLTMKGKPPVAFFSGTPIRTSTLLPERQTISPGRQTPIQGQQILQNERRTPNQGLPFSSYGRQTPVQEKQSPSYGRYTPQAGRQPASPGVSMPVKLSELKVSPHIVKPALLQERPKVAYPTQGANPIKQLLMADQPRQQTAAQTLMEGVHQQTNLENVQAWSNINVTRHQNVAQESSAATSVVLTSNDQALPSAASNTRENQWIILQDARGNSHIMDKQTFERMQNPSSRPPQIHYVQAEELGGNLPAADLLGSFPDQSLQAGEAKEMSSTTVCSDVLAPKTSWTGREGSGSDFVVDTSTAGYSYTHDLNHAEPPQMILQQSHTLNQVPFYANNTITASQTSQQTLAMDNVPAIDPNCTEGLSGSTNNNVQASIACTPASVLLDMMSQEQLAPSLQHQIKASFGTTGAPSSNAGFYNSSHNAASTANMAPVVVAGVDANADGAVAHGGTPIQYLQSSVAPGINAVFNNGMMLTPHGNSEQNMVSLPATSTLPTELQGQDVSYDRSRQLYVLK